MADIKPFPATAASPRPLRALSFWQTVVGRFLKELPADLSTRQMGILLTVYISPPPHSIKTLGEALGISKPAVCRAIDVLERLKLVKRARDAQDRRNVLIQRTVKGSVFLSDMAEIILATSKEVA